MGKKPTRGLTVKIDPKITVSLYNIEDTVFSPPNLVLTNVF